MDANAVRIITLALVMDYLPFPGETQFIGAAPCRRRRLESNSSRFEPIMDNGFLNCSLKVSSTVVYAN